MTLPYLKRFYEIRIEHLYRLRIVCRSNKKTLRTILTTVKPICSATSNNYIYIVPCKCGGMYVSKTKPPIEVSIQEHKIMVWHELVKTCLTRNVCAEYRRIEKSLGVESTIFDNNEWNSTLQGVTTELFLDIECNLF